MNLEKIQSEFDTQKQTLIDKGYPALAKLKADAFSALVDPLREKLSRIDVSEIDVVSGYLPFVIVVTHTCVNTTDAMAAIVRDGKTGITKLTPLTPEDFHSREAVTIPDAEAYILVGIDRGVESLNVRPQDALIDIQKNKRSPLTIDEGVAIVTQHPEFLMRNNCFTLLGSRHTGDKRVPAIWLNGKNHPNLGWCWDGNPHTWLGSASCSDRIA